jgi:Fic family protein
MGSKEEELQAIEQAVRLRASAVTTQQIANDLPDIPRRTLQRRLKTLVDERRLIKEGERRWAKYRAPQVRSGEVRIAGQSSAEAAEAIPLTPDGGEIQKYVRQPLERRAPAGYDRSFLDGYRPNVSFYLTEKAREHLREVGKSNIGEQAAGTYAKRILQRLLIDLSWNSSRLEGNTYSLLDTRRLIEFGQQAEGRQQREAQMILNHKDAIEFLVSAAEEIAFNRYTILNLHALLANNLLAEPAAAGRLRHIGVGIEKSTFHPLEVPQLIEECFDQILATAAAIKDPFEQSFFVMAQLPYLQPFDDVNKRVSRLAANIPLIKGNLVPLSFTDVPRATYTEAVLGVYELRKIGLLKDMFIWAYERSAARYAAVRQSLGEPDPFRLRHRADLHEVVGKVIRGPMDRKAASAHLAAWSGKNIDAAERERFREIAETELLGLHEGNFARYRIRPSEFAAWQEVWTSMSRNGRGDS